MNNKGNALYNQGKLDDAIKAWDEAIKLDPNDAVAWYNKGNALSDLGKYDDAIRAWDEAIKKNPQLSLAWYNKGNTLSNQGKYNDAIKAYDEATKLDPNYADAWYGKGVALNSSGQLDEAIKAYDEAIKLDSNYTFAWGNKGVTLSIQGKYNEAIKAYDKAIKLDPNYAKAWRNKGTALSNLGKYDEAIEAYNEAAKLDPNYTGTRYNNSSSENNSISETEAALSTNENLGNKDLTPIASTFRPTQGDFPPALGQTATIFNNWNGGVVENNPTSSTSFTILEPQMITYIDTYHWNFGKGTRAGTVSLKKDDGNIFGPWSVKSESGSGVANVWWISHPNETIPAGTYTIIDSEPETWSWNSQSKGCGFSRVEGYPENGLSGKEKVLSSSEKPKSSNKTSTTETEVAMEQSTLPDKVTLTTEGNAKGLSSNQKDFLQAVLDDLSKIGRKDTAVNLNKYISEGHAVIGKEEPGTQASVKSPTLGYLDPISSNNLVINQDIADQWAQYRERAVGFQVKGDSTKMGTSLQAARMNIRDLAFTLIHEDVHMGQYVPQETPKYENPAYERGISEERRVIIEDMQKIREIQGRGANLPGDKERLSELIEDLKISKDVYIEHIQSMQSDVIKTGIVDPDKFKTSYDDMIKLVDEVNVLINGVNSNVSDPCEGVSEPIKKLIGCG